MNTTIVHVYRWSLGDCTGNGLTNNVDGGILFWNCSREEAIEYCKQLKEKNSNMDYAYIDGDSLRYYDK